MRLGVGIASESKTLTSYEAMSCTFTLWTKVPELPRLAQLRFHDPAWPVPLNDAMSDYVDRANPDYDKHVSVGSPEELLVKIAPGD
jgi:hypothetical protein